MYCEKCGNFVKLTDCYCQKCGADLHAQKGTSTNTSVFRNLDLSSYGTSGTNQEHSGSKIFVRKQDFFKYPSDPYVAKNVLVHKILAWIYLVSTAISFILVIIYAARRTEFAKFWYDVEAGQNAALIEIGITTAIYLIVLGAAIILCGIGIYNKHFGVHIPLVFLSGYIYFYLFPRKLAGLAAVCWTISLFHAVVMLVLSVRLTNSYMCYLAKISAGKD